MSKRVQILLFILPGLILVGLFVYGFTAWTFQVSLTNWRDVGSAGDFVGLDNYIRLFSKDRVFKTSLVNTLKLTLVFIGVTIPLGLFLAVLLDLNLKGKQLFRLIFLLPLSFSFVASASMWTWMFSPEIGSVNALLRAIGLDSLTQPWITSDKQALICIAIAYVWQFSGFSTLVYYAGISGVAPEITEAAKIDGASTFQRYMKVIIPMQRPATLTVLMILLMYSLRVFDLVWLMTGGGPGSSTEILSTFMFRTAFNRNRFGYGAAVGVVMFAISILIVIPFFAKLRRSEYE
ncbi:MAG: sugar ABC transporter permease [Thermotogaceae bacterium]|uniref:carbohydrate ABC transporter permease n=1 Tax=Mesotoga sp. TaxID=2053577 RepID=UPI0016BA9A9E|nr:sugar ABC transporter permease [Thermotogota bacterium]NLT46070.1 sugar ABC transporter permease [Thermotogaceae bacterium]HNS34754.1 sugar ABC transporter permease [Mesotoga sp.]